MGKGVKKCIEGNVRHRFVLIADVSEIEQVIAYPFWYNTDGKGK